MLIALHRTSVNFFPELISFFKEIMIINEDNNQTK